MEIHKAVKKIKDALKEIKKVIDKIKVMTGDVDAIDAVMTTTIDIAMAVFALVPLLARSADSVLGAIDACFEEVEAMSEAAHTFMGR